MFYPASISSFKGWTGSPEEQPLVDLGSFDKIALPTGTWLSGVFHKCVLNDIKYYQIDLYWIYVLWVCYNTCNQAWLPIL